jgi:hypothetical protein
MSIEPSLPDNDYFPRFAKEKLQWLVSEQRDGRLAVIILESIDNTNLVAVDLMASGMINGQPTLVVVKPRFARFIEEESGRRLFPVSARIKHDFLLGVIHEVVHLQSLTSNRPRTRASRMLEESRTWREVSINVVRPLRRFNQPMNRSFIVADEALRECLDQIPCPQLLTIIIPH